jgi:hypothetical protein
MMDARFAKYYGYRQARVVDATTRLPVEMVAPLEKALVSQAGLSMRDNHTCFIFWAGQMRQAVMFSDDIAYFGSVQQLRVGDW